MKMYNEKNHSDLIKLKAYNKFIVKSLPRTKCTPFGKSSKVKIWVQYDLFKLLIWLKKKRKGHNSIYTWDFFQETF